MVIKYADKYYQIVPCVDCGVGHKAQVVLGQPRNPRCSSCAAKIRGMGRVCKPETKARISKSLMGHKGVKSWLGKKMPAQAIAKRKATILASGGFTSGMKGKNQSLETRERMSLAALARSPISQETRDKLSHQVKEWYRTHRHPMLGKVHTDEAKKKISEHSLQWHKTHQHPRLGYQSTREERERIGQQSRDRWSNPEYKERIVRKIIKANFQRPTLPEQKILELLNEEFPNEYKYSGDGRVIINGQAPDFVNINGQKKVIEVFGDYWHSEKVRGKCKEKEMQDKVLEYAQYGFGCLIIWEKELGDINKVRDKVVGFNLR